MNKKEKLMKLFPRSIDYYMKKNNLIVQQKRK